jgi:MFS family permease
MAFVSLFQTKAMFRRVIFTTVIQTFTQWVGVDAVLYYAPSMFVGLGISSNTTSLLATGVVGILIFLGTILAVFYVDRLGRKLVLIIGAIGMAASLVVAAVIVKTCSHDWPAHRAAG